MATTRSALTIWNGSLLEGSGQVTLDSSGVGSFPVSWPARSEEPGGMTSPEEMIAAAHSSCFAMALSNALAKAGSTPAQLETKAEVDFQPGVESPRFACTSRATYLAWTHKDSKLRPKTRKRTAQ